MFEYHKFMATHGEIVPNSLTMSWPTYCELTNDPGVFPHMDSGTYKEGGRRSKCGNKVRFKGIEITIDPHILDGLYYFDHK